MIKHKYEHFLMINRKNRSNQKSILWNSEGLPSRITGTWMRVSYTMDMNNQPLHLTTIQCQQKSVIYIVIIYTQNLELQNHGKQNIKRCQCWVKKRGEWNEALESGISEHCLLPAGAESSWIRYRPALAAGNHQDHLLRWQDQEHVVMTTDW